MIDRFIVLIDQREMVMILSQLSLSTIIRQQNDPPQFILNTLRVSPLMLFYNCSFNSNSDRYKVRKSKATKFKSITSDLLILIAKATDTSSHNYD